VIKLLIILWLGAIAQVSGDAVPPDDITDPGFPPALLEQAKSLGPWEDNADLERAAMSSMFENNGWNSEPDHFALDLVTRVNRIPPWQQQDRMEAFLGGIQERLDLNPDQRRQLSRNMQLESMRIGLNHLTEVLPVATEAIQTRAAGQPYSAEQVARWSKVLRPLAEEAREATERVARDLSRTMSTAQRDKLRGDLNALLRRHKDITTQMRDWEDGRWTPDAWGLQNDPIQNGAQLDPSKRPPPGGAQVAGVSAEDRADPGDPLSQDLSRRFESEWERYVREYGQRHDFTDAQRASARGILQDMLNRARRWKQANETRLAELRHSSHSGGLPEERARLSADLKKINEPLDRMFEELKGRLRGLLTSEQRSRTGVD